MRRKSVIYMYTSPIKLFRTRLLNKETAKHSTHQSQVTCKMNVTLHKWVETALFCVIGNLRNTPFYATAK